MTEPEKRPFDSLAEPPTLDSAGQGQTQTQQTEAQTRAQEQEAADQAKVKRTRIRQACDRCKSRKTKVSVRAHLVGWSGADRAVQQSKTLCGVYRRGNTMPRLATWHGTSDLTIAHLPSIPRALIARANGPTTIAE